VLTVSGNEIQANEAQLQTLAKHISELKLEHRELQEAPVV
jgi:hypothetical protein